MSQKTESKTQDKKTILRPSGCAPCHTGGVKLVSDGVELKPIGEAAATDLYQIATEDIGRAIALVNVVNVAGEDVFNEHRGWLMSMAEERIQNVSDILDELHDRGLTALEAKKTA